MKKIQKSLAITAILFLVSFGAFSQTSDSKTAKIKTLLELTGSANLGNQMLDQMIVAFQKNSTKVPEEFWTNFRKEIDMNGFLLKIIPIYDKHYTEADLDGLIAFYQSDVGKKVTATLPAIMQESMEMGQAWGREIGEKVIKKLKTAQEKTK